MTDDISREVNPHKIISTSELKSSGERMHSWARDLFPICRSITGDGLRATLHYIKNLLPDLAIVSVPSGTSAFDWVVPDEWNIRKAYIEDSNGNRIVDIRKNNLHIVSYSHQVNAYLSKEDLCEHLHSIAELPDAIPYVTSYYAKNWGFCISENQKKSLPEGMYHVLIDSELKPGVLNYGELVIPGMSSDEILISTYVCHPSMANNELSGPVVATAIAQWLLGRPNRRYTYRIIFVPETIGSIVYLSRNLDYMKKHTIAGFNLTCLGDDRCYSYLASREGNTLPDNVAEYVLSKYFAPSKRYTFLDRGSDERQYCSPLVDLPVVSLMRSKYGTFPEYHTSLDDLELVTPAGLAGSLNYVASCIYLLENNFRYKTTSPCEPQLGKRGLYPEIGTRNTRDQVKSMMNVLAYSDGNRTLLDIAKLIDVDFKECVFIADRLHQSGIIVKC